MKLEWTKSGPNNWHCQYQQMVAVVSENSFFWRKQFSAWICYRGPINQPDVRMGTFTNLETAQRQCELAIPRAAKEQIVFVEIKNNETVASLLLRAKQQWPTVQADELEIHTWHGASHWYYGGGTSSGGAYLVQKGKK